MALSRKKQREIKKIRKEADRLWAEQAAVIDHARHLYDSAKDNARELAEHEVVPALRARYDESVRPSVDRGVSIAKDVAADAQKRIGTRILPALAQISDQVSTTLHDYAGKAPALDGAASLTDALNQRAKQAVKEYEKSTKKKSGPGVGGWFLIGAGLAAAAAVGYALWQTFRSDDDLWIADEELDAPVTTVSPSTAAGN